MPGSIQVATFSRKEGRDMIFKPTGVCMVLAAMFAISGCNQTAPPANVAANSPSAPVPTASPAEPQATAPSSSARSQGPAEQAGREVGEAVDDATITTKVKAALLQAPDVKGLDVKVETDKAVVQLSGFVASQAQIDKAVELAKGVSGVREVQNKMSVKPS
jgi:hyperosmotically inducible periplasmic protein